MSKEVGRNDPCPCGSGKKYKYCCLPEEEERKTKKNSNEKIDHSGGEGSGWQGQLASFRRMDPDEKFEFFYEHYSDPEDVCGDYALEMLSDLFHESSRKKEWEVYLTLDEKIRSNRADLCEEFSHWLVRRRLLTILWSGKSLTRNDLKDLSREFVEDPDILNPPFMALLFRGSLDKLRFFFRITHSRFMEAEGLVPWAKDEFSDRGIDVEIFHWLTEAEVTHPDSESYNSLLKQLRKYHQELYQDRITELIDILAGRKKVEWGPEDFDIRLPEGVHDPNLYHVEKPEQRALPEEKRINYTLLGDEFQRYLHLEWGVPWTRAKMARDGITTYLLKRADEKLEPKGGMLDAMFREEQGKPKPRQETPSPEDILVPDGKTFKVYIIDHFPMLNPRYYEAIALYLSIKPWLEFLRTKSLIDQSQLERSIKELKPLKSELEEYCQEYYPDPEVLNRLDCWPEM